MIKFDEWYLPNGEEHLQRWMQNVNKRVNGRLTYQYSKYDAAKKFINDDALAIDIGAHVGLWSYFFAQDFKHVISFEPCDDHAQCWYKNMSGINNAELFQMALGETNEKISLETRTAGSSGDTQVNPQAIGNIDMRRLDDFEIDDVALIKIDCEGYEEFILRGAESTLVNSKPCIIVEQKPGHSARYGLEQRGAIKFLNKLGAKVRAEISGDYILSWD